MRMRISCARVRDKMAFLVSVSVLIVLVFCSKQGYAASSCPCDDPSLCEPIKGSPKNEILGFVTSQDNWPLYNWSLLTTVALFTPFNTSLLCYAHSKGVRVVLSASYPTSELQNLTNVEVGRGGGAGCLYMHVYVSF